MKIERRIHLLAVGLALLWCCAATTNTPDDDRQYEQEAPLVPASLVQPFGVRLSLCDQPRCIFVSWLTKTLVPDAGVEFLLLTPKHSVYSLRARVSAVPRQEDADAVLYKDGRVVVYRAMLTDLEPRAVYRYRVGSTSMGGVTYAATFVVPAVESPVASASLSEVGPEARVTLGIFADMGTWGGVVEFLPFLHSEMGLDAALHLGDLSYASTDYRWSQWACMLQPITSALPYLYLPGNWDFYEHSAELFRTRFFTPLLWNTALPTTTPAQQQQNGATLLDSTTTSSRSLRLTPSWYYYSFNYQSVHVVMLNSYEDYTRGSAQNNWLESDLAEANRSRHLRPWIVVCFHSPMYSSNAGHTGGDVDFKRAVEPLLVQYGVDLCFTGHDHGYERSYPVRDGRVQPATMPAHSSGSASAAKLYAARALAPLSDADMEYVRRRPSQSQSIYAAPLPAPIHLVVGIAGATLDPWMEGAPPAWSAHRYGIVVVADFFCIYA